MTADAALTEASLWAWAKLSECLKCFNNNVYIQKEIENGYLCFCYIDIA